MYNNNVPMRLLLIISNSYNVVGNLRSTHVQQNKNNDKIKTVCIIWCNNGDDHLSLRNRNVKEILFFYAARRLLPASFSLA